MKLRRRGGAGGWRSLLPEEREMRPWILAAVGVIVTFLAGYLVAARMLFPPSGEAADASLTEVPAVEGVALEEARERLEERGLAAGVSYRPAGTEADAGTVLAQRPLAGTMAPSGDTVALAVSRGTGGVRIPGLRGLTEERARTVLEELGLEVTSRSEPSPVRKGEVVETEPPAGQTPPSPGRVELVISEGPEVASVPDLVGLHVDDVPAVLRETGLELGTVEFDPGAAAAPGRVVGQSPPPGFALRRSGTVSVRVAGERGDWSPPPSPDTASGGAPGPDSDMSSTSDRGGG